MWWPSYDRLRAEWSRGCPGLGGGTGSSRFMGTVSVSRDGTFRRWRGVMVQGRELLSLSATAWRTEKRSQGRTFCIFYHSLKKNELKTKIGKNSGQASWFFRALRSRAGREQKGIHESLKMRARQIVPSFSSLLCSDPLRGEAKRVTRAAAPDVRPPSSGHCGFATGHPAQSGTLGMCSVNAV